MKLTEFIGITSRNMHVKFREVWRSFNFWQKNADSAWTLEKGWNLTFLKVLRNSWNLQNLLESPPGTCMWNLKQFGEVSIFDRKLPTTPDLRKRMNFDIFSKFSKIHETYRIYWSHLQEHACEIWSSLEEFQFLTKMPTAPSLRKRMKFWHFLKVLQNSWNLQNLLKSPPGTCMWNLEEFGEVSIFDRKMPTAPNLRKRMNFWHFLKGLQNS